MILRDISLHLNLDEYSPTYVSDFQFRSRYLCNYVRRRILASKVHTDGFRSIVVEGRHEPTEGYRITVDNVAGVTVRFDQQRYESLPAEELHEFFIEMLLEGLEKFARYRRIPLEEIKAAIDEFRRGGYRNEWLFKRKLLNRKEGLRASLLCSMDMEKFVLVLKLERKGETVFEQSILETKPDETIFAHKFKDVVLEGDTVVVRDLFGDPAFTLDLRSLS